MINFLDIYRSQQSNYLFKMENFDFQSSTLFVTIDQKAQEIFLTNYIWKKGVFLTLRSTLVILASCGVYYALIGGSPLLSLCLAVGALSAHVFERIRAHDSDPNRLANRSISAMLSGDENLAIEYIQKGANLDFVHPPLDPSDLPYNLFDYAAAHAQYGVLRHLTSIGFQFKKIPAPNEPRKTSCVLYRQGKVPLETIRYLVDALNLPVNNDPNDWRSSPLFVQTIYLKNLAQDQKTSRETIEEQAEIIAFLFSKGANFTQEELDKPNSELHISLVKCATNREISKLIQYCTKTAAPEPLGV